MPEPRPHHFVGQLALDRLRGVHDLDGEATVDPAEAAPPKRRWRCIGPPECSCPTCRRKLMDTHYPGDSK